MNIARQFLLGRYTYGDSVIHHLDPRIKILFLVVVSISLFFISNIQSFIYPFILLIMAVITSKIKFSAIFKGVVPILWLVGFSFVFHSFFPPRNIEYAFEISLRLLLLFCWATVMTTTTPNAELGKAVSWYAGPLKVLKVSPENVALTFSLSLRFFPIILEEADSIIKAQRLRKEKLGFKQRLESFCTVFMIRVLKKAQSIEFALINRNIKEENLKDLNNFGKLRLTDFSAIIICMGYTALFIFQ